MAKEVKVGVNNLASHVKQEKQALAMYVVQTRTEIVGQVIFAKPQINRASV